MGNFLCRRKYNNNLKNMEKQLELRKKISEVKDLNLPKAEEAKQIQALFYSKPKKEEKDQEKLVDEVSEFNEKAKNKVYQDEKNTVLGCVHYQVIYNS